MIFDTSHWPAFAIIREVANLIKPDTGQGERSILAFSFDLTLIQAQCLNDPREKPDTRMLPSDIDLPSGMLFAWS
jgi:hypothetical protein